MIYVCDSTCRRLAAGLRGLWQGSNSVWQNWLVGAMSLFYAA